MTIGVLDLFCGAGGSSAGARLAGARILGGIDMDPVATATYATNFKQARVETRRLDASSRPGDHIAEGAVDLLLASPECTNHSPAKGAGQRDELSRGTSHYVIGFAKVLRPRWIVLENVIQLKCWHGYSPLITQLNELGYRTSAQVLNAADFGVPQTRRRLFVIADREREPLMVSPIVQRTVAVGEIIQPEGSWRSRPLYSDGRAPATIARAERGIAALGKGVPFIIVYYGSDGSGGWQSLNRPLRTITTLDRFGLVTWNGREPMLRMLQVPELKAAMGISSSFQLDEGTRRDRIRLIGNGVSPPVMQAVVQSLIA